MKNLNYIKEFYARQYNTITAELNEAKSVETKIAKIKELAAQYNKDKASRKFRTPGQYNAWVVKMNYLDELLKKLTRV